MYKRRACPYASLRVGPLLASLRSVLRTLRPSRHLTQTLTAHFKLRPHLKKPIKGFISILTNFVKKKLYLCGIQKPHQLI